MLKLTSRICYHSPSQYTPVQKRSLEDFVVKCLKCPAWNLNIVVNENKTSAISSNLGKKEMTCNHPMSIEKPCLFLCHRRHFHSLPHSHNTSCTVTMHSERRYGNFYSSNVIQKRHWSKETYAKWLSPENQPFAYAQSILEKLHEVSGLPWWASIMLCTFALRTIVTLPLAIYSQYTMAKVELLQPEIMKLSEELKREVAKAIREFKWDEKQARFKYNSTMKKLIKDLYIRDNCHPLKISAVAWIQIPLWISMSITLRNMSGGWVFGDEKSPVLSPGFADEGMLWFPNLTVPDSTLILPVTLAVINLSIIELQTLKHGEKTKFQKYVVYGLRGISLCMIPIGASLPSSMCWYWSCSSMFGLVQNLLLKYPSVKRAVGIPQTPSESSTPFQDLMKAAKEKYGRKTGKEVDEK